MAEHLENPFKLYRIRSAPLVAQAYALCTAQRNAGGRVKSEAFVLIPTSPHDAVAFGSRFSYSDNTDGESPIVLDERFAMDDAVHQAETIYSMRSQELDPKLPEKLGWARPSFEEIPQGRLVAIWAHTPLSKSLLDIADATQCTALRDFIHSLRSLPTVKQTVLDL